MDNKRIDDIVKVLTSDTQETKNLLGVQRKILHLESAFMTEKSRSKKNDIWNEMQELIEVREEIIKRALRREL